VNPANRRVNSQSIESEMAPKVRRKSGIQDMHYDLHIAEFNWRERFGRSFLQSVESNRRYVPM
jgi:hypothetical protein